MCLQAPSYDARKHALYTAKCFLTYSQELLGMYDEYTGEEWFTDGEYKRITDNLMTDYSQTKERSEIIKEFDVERIRELGDWKKYTELMDRFQRRVNGAVIRLERAAENIRNGKFRISCIYELYDEKRINNEEMIEKYGIDIDALTERFEYYFRELYQ